MSINEIKPKEFKIKIKNKEYQLKYDLEAFANVEQMLGDMQKAFDDLNNHDLTTIKIFLYSGLIHEKESIPLRDIQKMTIDGETLKVLFDAINDSLVEGFNFFKEYEWSFIYYIGTVSLKMSEEEFWKSTPRKIVSLIKILEEVKNKGNDKSKLKGNDGVDAFAGW